MRVLLIKTSSMGDIIHTFPALTDACFALDNVVFDWVIEEPFIDIPGWHNNVERVIPVALRRWRKGLFSRETREGLKKFKKMLKGHHYDLVLDAQGLMKSAFLGFFAEGLRVGLDFRSAREKWAALCYQRVCSVDFHQHAVVRMRRLFSQALQYPLPDTPPQFGLHQANFLRRNVPENTIVFLHGTTWVTKQWPEQFWIKLGQLANAAGFVVKISGGNVDEVERAGRIARASQNIDLLPYLSIKEMANVLVNARAVVSVDTGFGHLAAALNVPTVSLYGPTDPAYTGALGKQSTHLAAGFACAPCLQRKCTYKGIASVNPACFGTLSPETVWSEVEKLMAARS